MASDNPTSEAPTSNIAPRPDLPTLLDKLYAALRDWGLRHKKLTEKIAARVLLREITELQPEFCRGKTWPKWVPILKKIRKGRRAIGDDAEERPNSPRDEHLTLRYPLAWAAGRAKSWLEERLDAFSSELQFPPLWDYVIARMKKNAAFFLTILSFRTSRSGWKNTAATTTTTTVSNLKIGNFYQAGSPN